MNSLCKYRDIFGKPREGAHAYRIFNLAVVDILATLLVGAVIAWVFSFPIAPTLVILFLLGILAHRLFCVRTTVDTLLFPTAQ